MRINDSVMVTGGSGFLGSHLCERLLRMGRDVVCVDNFYTGTKRNIEHLLGNSRFELLRHDVTFPQMGNRRAASAMWTISSTGWCC
jgi:nucleoside-diphosphate-sugar epimerase